MKKMLIMLATLCAAFAINAQEAPEAKKAPEKNVRPPRNGGQTMMLERIKKDASELLALYDADGDGKINDAEKENFKKDMEVYKKLQKYNRTLMMLDAVDANNDMVIDAEEAKKVKDAMEKMLLPQGGRRPNGQRPNGPRPNGKRPADAPKAPEAAE